MNNKLGDIPQCIACDQPSRSKKGHFYFISPGYELWTYKLSETPLYRYGTNCYKFRCVTTIIECKIPLYIYLKNL